MLGLLVAAGIVLALVAAVLYDLLGPRRRRPDVDDAALRRGVAGSARHRSPTLPPQVP